MRQTIKELTIIISPEKLDKLRGLVPKIADLTDGRTVEYLNLTCKEGKVYYSFQDWFRVYLPAIDIWLFLGSGLTPSVGGKYKKGVVEVERRPKLSLLPAITLEFELQNQKSQVTKQAKTQKTGARAIIFTEKMLYPLRQSVPSLQKLDNAAIMDYLNKNAKNISYRKAIGSTNIFIENLNITLKIGSGKKVVGIKRDLNARGNKMAEVEYKLEK